jgi:hypothetical protein
MRVRFVGHLVGSWRTGNCKSEMPSGAMQNTQSSLSVPDVQARILLQRRSGARRRRPDNGALAQSPMSFTKQGEMLREE